MAHQEPSSWITYKWTYDVFLSFYGDDTRLGFTSHLHQALRQRGIRVFLDDECIRTGENITSTLFKAIEESRIAIIVFSGNYANSTFCLRELEMIVECFKKERRLIYPIFYHVDPSELRNPRESYAEALAQLEERFKDERHKVEKWRLALSQAADLKGCHMKPKIANEQVCIREIAKEVATRINREPLHVTNYPVGLVPRVKEVISYLDLGSTEKIKMIGIWGAGGIGKSTIARALYNSIADNFEGLCFLFNVRKRSKEPNGLSHLQETLLSKLVMAKDLNFGDYHEGIPIIQHRLCRKKILLILDDVDESDQLKALVGSCNWFGCGSRIIITTKDKQLLKSHGIESIYDVKGLNNEESLMLLSWYAFKKENVDSNYVEVCNRAIDYSCGFPLALEVIGSNLVDKGVNLWNSALQQFKSKPDRTVVNALKLSFDMLEVEEKQVFLDLACFFNGEKLANIIDILIRVRPIDLKYAIDVLTDKSLIKIVQDRVTMHDLIEDVGKEIVRQESPNEPGERSRLWFYEDILHVIQLDTGTNKVEAIILDMPESIEVQWSGEELKQMKNLKMLVIRKACFSECPKYLPNSLRWLEWKGYPFKLLPHQKFMYLSHMSLRNCNLLQQIPDLSSASNLTELWLDGCTNLIEIHDSVGCLNKLRELSAMKCTNLKILPSCLKLTSLKYLKLFGCSSLRRFPEIAVMMKEIRTLDLDKTAITELPSSICNLIGLEMLNVEECRNLKQLPASICKLPKLWKLTADSCEEMSHFMMCEDGDEASLDCSKMSSKMTHFHFSNCNLSDNTVVFCLSHFTKVVHLDLSFNKFTVLPECIKEHCNLKYLLLDNCNQLQHIRGMPPNLEKLSAICCTSLTQLSRSIVLKQAFNFEPGKRNFILPGRKFPKRLHYCGLRSCVSFWVRNVFPTTFLWILVKDDHDYIYNCVFSVYANENTELDLSSYWRFGSTIRTNHIYICDIGSMIQTEFPLGNKWNKVTVSARIQTQEIYFGVHVCDLQSSFESIQFLDPRRCIIDHNLLQNIQGQQDLEELEEDMNLDLNSTKSAELIENPMHYREREIMNKLQPWDLGFLEVAGYKGTTFPTWFGSRFYYNLTKLRLIYCQNCWRIPALGQLPALRYLTIKGLQSVVVIGSEFFKGHDCASLILFPSLESLKFGSMISWEEWHLVDMETFPKLRNLRFDDCPKLIGNLPLQLVSLEFLEIVACPLLASPIPKCPKLHKLCINESQKVVLQEQELPPSLHRQAISGAPMLESLSKKLRIEYLTVEDCSDVLPLPVIDMPPSVEHLRIAYCENLKFVLVSKAPFYHLRRISIRYCKVMTSLFDDMEHLLPNLQELCIAGCPEMEPFAAGSLPSSLKQLEIKDCDKLLSHMEWHHLPTITRLLISTPSDTLRCRGLRLLTSLQELQISYSPYLESIRGTPSSLKQLEIRNSDKLLLSHMEWHHLRTITKLLISTLSDTMHCRVLQHLTSLQELQILNSPFVKTIKGVMPPSLRRLIISGCSLLEERCRNKDDKIWLKISHVSHISLNGTVLRDLLKHMSDPCISSNESHISHEEEDLDDATIEEVQSQSATKLKLKAMIKFFKGCISVGCYFILFYFIVVIIVRSLGRT